MQTLRALDRASERASEPEGGRESERARERERGWAVYGCWGRWFGERVWMRQPITMWPLKQQVSQGCVWVCKVCARGARGWWGEGWGDAWCQVSGLIMALPAQSGRLVGWELYKPQKRGQEATKLHTRANPAFARAHALSCLLATRLGGQGEGMD